MAEEQYGQHAAVFASVLGAALWRFRWLIAVATVLAGVAGYYLSSMQPNTWSAQSSLVLATSENFNPLGGSGAVAPARFIANQMSIIQSEPVLGRAVAILSDGTSQGDLAAAITVEAPADSDILKISAEAPERDQAVARANAVSNAYQQYRLAQVQDAAQRAVEVVAADSAAVINVRTEAAVYGNGVSVAEAAATPKVPSSPQPRRDAVLLALLAAFTTSGIALWRRDGQSQQEGEDLAEQMSAPLLGVVGLPMVRGELVRPEPDGFDMALVALDYSLAGHPGPVLVTGLERASGAPALTLGLAAAAARNRRVLVVDADVEEQSLLALSGAPSPATRIEEFAGQDTSQLVSTVPIRGRNSPGSFDVSLLGRGLLGPSSEVGRARRTFGLLNGEYDLVLVHAGPLSMDAVAFSLLREVGSVVVAAGGTGRHEIDAFVPATRHVLSLAGRSCDGLVVTTPRKVRGRRDDQVSRAVDDVPPVAPTVAINR